MTLTVDTALIQLDDQHALQVGSDDPLTAEFFEERDLEGNGYTWTGIVEAIARLEMPAECDQFDWSPEADNLLVLCRDAGLLRRLEQHLQQYVADEVKLELAIENANPEMLD